MDLTDDLRHQEILHLTSLAEVFGGFAHEIAQPLNAIMIASQVLQLKVERSLLTDAEKSFLVQRLNIVTHQVQRATDIVEAVRGFARRSGGRVGESHMVSIFRRILGLMDQQFVMRSIEVTFDEAEGMTPVTEDVDTVERVMVQALAFSRDTISAIGSWHAERGIAYEKKVQIHLSQNESGHVMHLEWSRGQLPENSILLDSSVHTGLATAAAILTARGGSLSAGDQGLAIVFAPCK